MRGQGLLLQNQHYVSLWAMTIMLFPWNVWLCVPERKSSLCALEALSYTTEESQENSSVICTFHQHFKRNPWKRYGKRDGRPLRALSDEPVARQMSLFLFIYFWNQSASKSALLFWSYNHHLVLPQLVLPWEISLKSIEKEGRMEGLLWRGCRREPAFISKCVNWKMCRWKAK